MGLERDENLTDLLQGHDLTAVHRVEGTGDCLIPSERQETTHVKKDPCSLARSRDRRKLLNLASCELLRQSEEDVRPRCRTRSRAASDQYSRQRE